MPNSRLRPDHRAGRRIPSHRVVSKRSPVRSYFPAVFKADRAQPLDLPFANTGGETPLSAYFDWAFRCLDFPVHIAIPDRYAFYVRGFFFFFSPGFAPELGTVGPHVFMGEIVIQTPLISPPKDPLQFWIAAFRHNFWKVFATFGVVGYFPAGDWNDDFMAAWYFVRFAVRELELPSLRLDGRPDQFLRYRRR